MAGSNISFAQRVDQVARRDAESKAFITSEFLDGVTDGLREWENQFRRHLARALIVAIIFIALIEASVKQISFGGLELTDLSLPLTMIPVYFAYTTVDVMVARVGAQAWRRVWSSAMSLKEPDACRSHIELFMLPAQPYVLSEVVDHSTVGQGNAWTNRALSVATMALFHLAVLPIPLIFLLYSYVRLFDRNGAGDWLTWISLVLAVLLTAEVLIVLVLGSQIR